MNPRVAMSAVRAPLWLSSAIGAHGHAAREHLDPGRLGARALERRLDRVRGPNWSSGVVGAFAV